MCWALCWHFPEIISFRSPKNLAQQAFLMAMQRLGRKGIGLKAQTKWQIQNSNSGI